MKFTIAILSILLASPTAYAQMYKCESGGKVSYQQSPCSGGKQSVIKAQSASKSDLSSNDQYADGVALGTFNIKYERPNIIGTIWFSYKVGVTNSTPYAQKIRAKYNAVDAEGFLIDYVHISGTVPPNSYKVLSDRDYFEPEEKAQVYKWELDQ